MVPAIDTEDNVSMCAARSAHRLALIRAMDNLKLLEPLELHPLLFAKPAELVSFNHGTVAGVKFAAIVEVFVHD